MAFRGERYLLSVIKKRIKRGQKMAEEEQKTNGELKPRKRPEYVSEKFWNADTNEVNLEDLASSYNSLEKKLGSRTEELSKQIRQDIEQERIANTP